MGLAVDDGGAELDSRRRSQLAARVASAEQVLVTAAVEGDVPPELVGQIAVMNDEVEVWNAAAYYLGIAKCSTEPEDGRRILELLHAQG